ncbi:PREDICTED: caltractin-like [Haliaeetus leucocephalus]|uniref:caltractin-like n=1 Tax=Haliaeetus leucocephalus TaxID=52644 RepID=UPI00053CC5E4|nr:PREDICTED: caltractin-like [Haliaeetus leucocephalus]
MRNVGGAEAGRPAGCGMVSGAAGSGRPLRPRYRGAPQGGLETASSWEGGTAEGGSPTEEPAPAFPVSQEEREELREVFELFDPDGSGLIDVSDLKITVRALGCELREEEVERIFSECSEEGSGKLTFELFLQVMTQKMAEPCLEEVIPEAFEVFDYDGTGKIAFENLRVMASEVGEDITDEELQEMIDEADVDGDGDVDEQEFLRILTLTDP